MSSLSNKINNTSKKNISFMTPQNIFYIILVSVCVCAVVKNFVGVSSLRNIFELYIIVLLFTIALMYQFIVKKKMSLEKLEFKSIIYFVAFLLLIFFFGLFIKFTSNEKKSVEGKIFGIIFLLLVLAFINTIFFIINIG